MFVDAIFKFAEKTRNLKEKKRYNKCYNLIQIWMLRRQMLGQNLEC
jgi:hypothetical protein